MPKKHNILIIIISTLFFACDSSFKLDNSKIELRNLKTDEPFKFQGTGSMYHFNIHIQNQNFNFSLNAQEIPYPLNLILSYLNAGDSISVKAQLTQDELDQFNQIFNQDYTFHSPRVEFILVRKSDQNQKTSANILENPTTKEEAYQAFYNSIELHETSEGETLGRGVVKYLVQKGSKEPVIYGSYYLIKYKMYHLQSQLKLLEETPENGIIVQVGNDALIEGLSIALHSMTVGEQARFYVPYFLAFGTQATDWLPAFSNLMFQIEIIQKVKAEQ